MCVKKCKTRKSRKRTTRRHSSKKVDDGGDLDSQRRSAAGKTVLVVQVALPSSLGHHPLAQQWHHVPRIRGKNQQEKQQPRPLWVVLLFCEVEEQQAQEPAKPALQPQPWATIRSLCVNRERLLQLSSRKLLAAVPAWLRCWFCCYTKPFSAAFFFLRRLLVSGRRGCTRVVESSSAVTAAPWPAVSPTTPQDEEHHPEIIFRVFFLSLRVLQA